MLDYLGPKIWPTTEVVRELIRLVLASPAVLAVIPAQDLLGLGSEARMNRPGSRLGNWRWRLTTEQMEGVSSEEIARLLGETRRRP